MYNSGMIIGFFGKGGSGKSSLATQMALYLHNAGKEVFAIDADHNMDFGYNLTNGSLPSDMPCLGNALTAVRSFVGLHEQGTCDEAFSGECAAQFSLDPIDSYTDTYSYSIKDRLHLMMAGSQTDTILYGKACSHILTTPLKIYLPLLDVGKNGVVVMDEKAGADGVTTGIVTGIDVGIIVCEPSLHSTKTAKQITNLMTFFETPCVLVGNKVTNEKDHNFITQHSDTKPIAFFSENTSIKQEPSTRVDSWNSILQSVFDHITAISRNDRLERTKRKFARNHSFAT